MMMAINAALLTRPSPHGEGGLKYDLQDGLEESGWSPSPHGEGGLKWRRSENEAAAGDVPPRTGRVD